MYTLLKFGSIRYIFYVANGYIYVPIFYNNDVYGRQLFHDKARVEDDIFEIYAYFKKMGTYLYPFICVV